MKRTLTKLAALAFLASLASAFASADEMIADAPAPIATDAPTTDWYGRTTYSAAQIDGDIIRLDRIQIPTAPASTRSQQTTVELFPNGFNRNVLQLRQSFSLSVDNGQLRLGDRRAGQRPVENYGLYSSRSSFVDNPSNIFDTNHALFQ